MDEIEKITEKYKPEYIGEALQTLESLNQFALIFFKDVAEIYDCLTRMKNPKRNPSGFMLDDAPILGLLVKVAKLMREVVAYYERDNAEVIGIIERPMIEAVVTAHYLMITGPEVMFDYRKCAFKDRLRILRNLKEGSPFYETKAGKRLLRSVNDKLAIEGFTVDDFVEQKKNGWKLQNKRFFDIFAEIVDEDLYAATYGMMSESIHGSWAESLDWCLRKQDDKTYKPYLFSYPADIRFVGPTLRFCNPAFRLWLERIDCYDEDTRGLLDWIDLVNMRLFQKFDSMFDDFKPPAEIVGCEPVDDE
ncbi:MAG: hypothetical protein AUJ12_05305 [Alphaproteobacteria bacterium CG1_02_46_17]|nr:MAG: hypothetical protein AUJ12_05305 [Alphaproteobacteria bacterium CG1_02_46_17]